MSNPDSWKVQLFRSNYDDREIRAASEVLSDGWLTMGDRTVRFEEEFAGYIGEGKHATALSSGTAALHLALLGLGIGPGDEVLVSSLTFVADINVIFHVGARPVLVDSRSLDDWNISMNDLRNKITSRTRAIIATHYAGFPCPMQELSEISSLYKIKLIEDASHAIGAEYKNIKIGAFGDAACFSMYANKNLSMGEGGMFVTGSKELDRVVKNLRSHGMTTASFDRYNGRTSFYNVLQPGWNYRPDDMRSAIGLVQLHKLEEANQKRKHAYQEYIRLLQKEDRITIPFQLSQIWKPSYHIFPVLLSTQIDRMKVIEFMKQEGIQTSIHYPYIQNFTAFKEILTDQTPVTRQITERELTLPLYPDLSSDEINLVVDVFRRALDSAG